MLAGFSRETGAPRWRVPLSFMWKSPTKGSLSLRQGHTNFCGKSDHPRKLLVGSPPRLHVSTPKNDRNNDNGDVYSAVIARRTMCFTRAAYRIEIIN